jgi:hypothetical protein
VLNLSCSKDSVGCNSQRYAGQNPQDYEGSEEEIETEDANRYGGNKSITGTGCWFHNISAIDLEMANITLVIKLRDHL